MKKKAYCYSDMRYMIICMHIYVNLDPARGICAYLFLFDLINSRLCHPGPCPECNATITKSCDCGKTK